MRPIDVAYGVPERSVSEEELRAALGIVARNFDEAPARMHAVLGPPGQGIRWFSFACTVFQQGSVLAQDHFSEVMETELAELLVVVRQYGDEPATVELRGTSGSDLTLVRAGDSISAVGLPGGAARDGEIDEIALAALGLPIVRPFAALGDPRYQVVLRGEDIDTTYPIVKLTKGVLPVRVNPRLGFHGGVVRFARTPRIVDVVDDTALNDHVERVMQKAEARSVHEDRIIAIAHDIVRVGPAIAPVLVERLAQPKPRPARTQMTLTALGLLDLAADAIIPWLARSTEPVQRAAFCALARQGEAARPALARASTSKKSAERVAAQALLAILDAAEFAPIRETRALRDSLEEPARAEIAASFTTRELPQTLVFEHAARFAWYLRAAAADEQAHPKIGHAVRFADDDCMWAIALLLIETPISSAVSGARETILRGAAQRFGADFGPVADVLLRLPPFADDRVLGALARGKPIPGYEELRAAERRTLDAKNKPAANKKR